MNSPEIKKGIPMPESKRWGPKMTILEEMVRGDCIEVEYSVAQKWRTLCSSKFPGEFTSRRIDNDTVRIWKK